MAAGRDEILERLHRDLIGPDDIAELIPDRPSDRYLTGILWPPSTKMTGEEMERLGAGNEDGNDGGEEEEVPMVGTMRPSTAGISFAVRGEHPSVNVHVTAAYYKPSEEKGGKVRWQRTALQPAPITVDCAKPSSKEQVPGAEDGVILITRSVPWKEKGAHLVTVTLVNGALPGEISRQEIEKLTLFQVGISIVPSAGTELLPRPDLRPVIDEDDKSAALLYRNARQYAVGHTCSAHWSEENGRVGSIATAWIPIVKVPAVPAQGHEVFRRLREDELPTLDAEWLANASDSDLKRALLKLPQAYRVWISQQRKKLQDLPSVELRETADRHLQDCESVARRLEIGAERIAGDAKLAMAFRFANKAMVIQRRWTENSPLTWWPFQLGFLMLSAVSAVLKDSEDRRTMDLLWFPTGGGKTEAYLGLIAFVAFARRLIASPGDGVAAIMRYTLRLLTTQQFTRAAAMMMACEAIRRGCFPGHDDHELLGQTPFGIGLWVGGDATPNDVATAAAALQNDEAHSTPKQIVSCPACHEPLKWSEHIVEGRPRRIDVMCINKSCVLHAGAIPLPIHTVDEDVYAARPTLLIGTVDKFAQIVRNPAVGRLFDAGGPQTPDLVIQDELHLISGPLGTMVGLYEAGIDRLFWNSGLPPKVIGSTATIRRASEQVHALFHRKVCQFPPPGLDADDSGFAVTDRSLPGRLYAGVTTAGRSAKFTLQAVSGSLLQSGQAGFPNDQKRDPYWTLVAYFNSLRELGGAVVLMQDDVPDAIRLYAQRRGETGNERSIPDVRELTSRRTQKEVRAMLDDMAIPVDRDGVLDVVLASNMLSVGVDIPRLGLMLVNGQPKGVAEYIQSTSRVGRRHPGLVVCLLNNGKARDRSHYETFLSWHSTLYRDVEATSVTPFASRARDRALHAALVAAARHLVPGLSDRPRLTDAQIAAIETLIDDLVARAQDIDSSETAVRVELERFLHMWRTRGSAVWWDDRNPGRSLLVSAETAATLHAQGLDARGAVSTPNSMRNVEAGVPFRMATVLAPGKTRP